MTRNDSSRHHDSCKDYDVSNIHASDFIGVNRGPDRWRVVADSPGRGDRRQSSRWRWRPEERSGPQSAGYGRIRHGEREHDFYCMHTQPLHKTRGEKDHHWRRARLPSLDQTAVGNYYICLRVAGAAANGQPGRGRGAIRHGRSTSTPSTSATIGSSISRSDGGASAPILGARRPGGASNVGAARREWCARSRAAPSRCRDLIAQGAPLVRTRMSRRGRR